MERRTTEMKRRDWRGEQNRNGLYQIEYDTPMSVMEILTFGPASLAARIVLFVLVFGSLSILFSMFAGPIFTAIRKVDIWFTILGLAVLAGSFVLGKKFGRPFAIMLKWVGMPLVFLGLFGIVFARCGLSAFWIGPVDLFLGDTSKNLIADGVGNGAFHGILKMLMNLKMMVIKGQADSSILTLLIQKYRSLGATMNHYAVIPVLILISLGVFIGTLLIIWISVWLTLLIPVAACAGLSRLLIFLDYRF